MENTKFVVRHTYETATIYTLVLVVVYALNRSSNIPLTYRTPFADWDDLKHLLSHGPGGLGVTYNYSTVVRNRTVLVGLTPSWQQVAALAWCPEITTSPLCVCLHDFYQTTYQQNILAGVNAQTYIFVDNVTDSCLRARPTWRKDTCASFCSVHIAVPVMLLCLFASLFFSRIVKYESHALNTTAYYAPLVLAVVVIVMMLFEDLAGGVIASLTVLCALFEVSYVPPCAEDIVVFWNCNRFLISAVAVWAAVTHQARDLYLVPAYGTLGFILGIFAYYESLARVRLGNDAVKTVGLFLWVGMSVITGGFVLLVQQHWYPFSPARSSLVSVAALFVQCAQCMLLYVQWTSDRVNLWVGLFLLAFCTISVLVDIASQ